MGYACPVCTDPQADGEHLANHLAFTALLGDDGHEAWLDEHAPEWESLDPPTLAERVTQSVPETEFPDHFEDTVPGHDGHQHAHDTRESLPDHNGPIRADAEDLDAETRAILDRARDLTEQRRDEPKTE